MQVKWFFALFQKLVAYGCTVFVFKTWRTNACMNLLQGRYLKWKKMSRNTDLP